MFLLVAIGIPATTWADVLLFDDFDDGVIGPETWSTPYGGVEELLGTCRISHRGYLKTALQYAPARGLVVKARWRWLDSIDIATIAVRTDGVQSPDYLRVQNGVFVDYWSLGEVYAARMVNGVLTTLGYNLNVPVIAQGDWFTFEVTDDGASITCLLNGSPVLSVSESTSFAVNHIVFMNRETAVTSEIDRVSVATIEYTAVESCTWSAIKARYR
jgi:hypothetical protein